MRLTKLRMKQIIPIQKVAFQINDSMLQTAEHKMLVDEVVAIYMLIKVNLCKLSTYMQLQQNP